MKRVTAFVSAAAVMLNMTAGSLTSEITSKLPVFAEELSAPDNTEICSYNFTQSNQSELYSDISVSEAREVYAAVSETTENAQPSVWKDQFFAKYPESDLYVADCLSRGFIDIETLQPSASGYNMYQSSLEYPYLYNEMACAAMDNKDSWTDEAIQFGAGMWTVWKRFSSGDFDLNSETELYEALLMDYLTFECKQSSYKSDLIKNTAKYGWTIHNKLLSGMQSNDRSRCSAILKGNATPTAGELKVFESIKKEYLELKHIQKYVTAINDLEEVGSNAKSFYEKLTKLLAIQEADEGRKSFLLQMKEAACDNEQFCEAIDQVIEHLEASYESLSLDAGWDVITDYAIQKAWGKIIGLHPGLAPLKLYGTGLNVMFNNDDQAANYYKLVLHYTIEQYAMQSLRSLCAAYRSSGNADDARAFLKGFRSYVDYQSYASNWTRSYVSDALFEGLYNSVGRIFSGTSDENYAVIVEALNATMSTCERYKDQLDRWQTFYFNIADDFDICYTADNGSEYPLIDTGVTYEDEKQIASKAAEQEILTDEPKNYQDGFDYGKLHYSIIDEGNRTCCVVGFANGVNGKKETSLIIPSAAYLETDPETNEYIQYSVVSMRPFSLYTNIVTASIPSTFDSLPDYAFSDCKGLTNIYIPYTVTTLGREVFSGCEGLTAIPKMIGITSIPEGTFSYCTGLTVCNLPPAVDTIGTAAFSDCASLSGLEIPSTVKTIEDAAFAYTGLTKIVIPETVNKIGSGAFRNCAQLESAYIPHGVTVGDRTFECCNNLKSAVIMNTDTIGKQTFWGNTSLETLTLRDAEHERLSSYFCGKNQHDAYSYPNYEDIDYSGVTSYGGYPKTLKSVKILSGTEIAPHFFEYASLIQKFILPDTITTIGDYAFCTCHSLAGLDFLPKSVRIIGNSAFENISVYDENFSGYGHSIERINIPYGIEVIGNKAFFGIETASELSIPATVKTIGECAFAYCGMRQAVIPDGVETVGEFAFMECRQLENLVIPDSVTQIGKHVAAQCPHLKKLTVPTSDAAYFFSELFYPDNMHHPFPISDIYEGTDFELYYVAHIDPDDGIYGMAYEVNHTLKEITVSGGSVIAECAFYGMKSLEKVILPESVDFIGDNAFYHSTSLNELLVYNRNCEFSEYLGLNNDTVIYGYTDSTAKKYADQHQITFIPFDPQETVTTTASVTSATTPVTTTVTTATRQVTTTTTVTTTTKPITTTTLTTTTKPVTTTTTETTTTKPVTTTTTATTITKPVTTTTTAATSMKPITTTTTVTTTTKLTTTTTTVTTKTVPITTTTTATTTTKPVTTTTTETTTETNLPQKNGDINEDGIVSVSDAVLFARFLSEDLSLYDSQEISASATDLDFNNDGLITILDIIVLLKMIASAV